MLISVSTIVLILHLRRPYHIILVVFIFIVTPRWPLHSMLISPVIRTLITAIVITFVILLVCKTCLFCILTQEICYSWFLTILMFSYRWDIFHFAIGITLLSVKSIFLAAQFLTKCSKLPILALVSCLKPHFLHVKVIKFFFDGTDLLEKLVVCLLNHLKLVADTLRFTPKIISLIIFLSDLNLHLASILLLVLKLVLQIDSLLLQLFDLLT